MKVLKFKKIISFLMLILMLFSVAQPVFAASGSGKWVGGQFASYIKTTDNANSQYGVLLRRLINYTTGEQRTVFCAEHGIDFDTGVVYSGEYYTPTNSTLRKACKIAYLGWYKQHGDYVINGGTSDANKKQYVLTQQFIWETLGQSSATFIDSDIQAEYVRFKSNIENQISQIQARPSFNGTTIKTTAGESKTITDTNGVLSSYKSLDKTENGIRYQHTAGNNNMTITVNENVETENIRISDSTFQSWGMIKEGTEDNDTTVFFEFPSGTQDQLYAMQYNDPVTLNLALKIETYGKLELQKLNTNGDLVNGAVFNVRGPNGYNQDITVTNGKITIGGVKYNSIDEYLAKYKTEPIPTTESYVGYYADINDDGTVDGVIYADLAFDANGTWSSTNSSTFSYKASSNLKNYTISTKTYEGQTTAGTYTAKGFGEKSVLVPNGETGNDRFYVMALENFTDGTNTTFYWYYNAYGNMSDYATATSTAFGTGKANTLKMIEYWNAETPYGTQNTRDLWGVIQNSENYDIVESVNDSKKWFVPSKDEWSAFGSNLGITLYDYNSKYGLSKYYWSSSQGGTDRARNASFCNGCMNFTYVTNFRYVRLSATF